MTLHRLTQGLVDEFIEQCKHKLDSTPHSLEEITIAIVTEMEAETEVDSDRTISKDGVSMSREWTPEGTYALTLNYKDLVVVSIAGL